MKNKTVLTHLAAGCLAGFLLLSSFSARADIVLSPSTAGVIGVDLGNSNCEPGCVYSTFGLTNDGSLSLFYKAEADGGADEGTFASSYNTVFSNTPADPSDALLSYIGGSVITCPECYLVQCAALFCTYPTMAASAVLARVTLARMSDARAVQMNGLGSM
ncbi:MAG: hypothetical protein H0U56_05645, partial [Methylibium sp.]|uniref:hypothetical protein n=1 Tax=Methylibium sp. TaxID=2067992 RepID=UPI0017DE2FBE